MSKESKPPSQPVSPDVAAHSQAPAHVRADSAWNELAVRMKRGDAAALAELYDGTSAVVYGMLLRMLGDAAAAQETLVDVYARAWSQIHRFDPGRSSLVAWLVLFARSVALERPDRKASPANAAAGSDQSALDRIFFEGVQEGDVRGALTRLRQKKGGGA